ncbi:hypothetical protein NL676_025899 [Syzygium grande]|nr:hypothetical protein NL676_025899 [Syzygium grande]
MFPGMFMRKPDKAEALKQLSAPRGHVRRPGRGGPGHARRPPLLLRREGGAQARVLDAILRPHRNLGNRCVAVDHLFFPIAFSCGIRLSGSVWRLFSPDFQYMASSKLK